MIEALERIATSLVMEMDKKYMVKIFNKDCLELIPKIKSKVSLILTDPPYGINFKSGRQLEDRRQGFAIKIRDSSFFEKISNDDSIPLTWLELCYPIVKNCGAIYVFCHWRKLGQLYSAVCKAGFIPKNLIVLNKSNHGMGDTKGSYAPKHELILFSVKGRHKCNWSNGRLKDVIDVHVKYSGAHRLHPNEKPISWMTKFIETSSNKGEWIFDPFMGSGSTGEAAIKLDRNFLGCELDKNYFDIAESRLGQRGIN